MSVTSGSKYEERAMQAKKQAYASGAAIKPKSEPMVFSNAHYENAVAPPTPSGEITSLLRALGGEIETSGQHLARLKEVIDPIVRKSDGIAGIAGMGSNGADMSELGRELLSHINRLIEINSETARLLNSVAL